MSSSLSPAVVRANPPLAFPPCLPASRLLFSCAKLSQLHLSCHRSTTVSTAWLCYLGQWCWCPHVYLLLWSSLYALFHDAPARKMLCLPQLSWRYQTLLQQPWRVESLQWGLPGIVHVWYSWSFLVFIYVHWSGFVIVPFFGCHLLSWAAGLHNLHAVGSLMDSAESVFYDASKVTATNVMAILLCEHCDLGVNNGVVQYKCCCLLWSGGCAMETVQNIWQKLKRLQYMGTNPGVKKGIAILSLSLCLYWSW